MVRDVIMFVMDLQKVEQRLKELQQAVSLVNLVGQYLPPLPKIDMNGFMQQFSNIQPDRSPEKRSENISVGFTNAKDLSSLTEEEADFLLE